MNPSRRIGRQEDALAQGAGKIEPMARRAMTGMVCHRCGGP